MTLPSMLAASSILADASLHEAPPQYLVREAGDGLIVVADALHMLAPCMAPYSAPGPAVYLSGVDASYRGHAKYDVATFFPGTSSFEEPKPKRPKPAHSRHRQTDEKYEKCKGCGEKLGKGAKLIEALGGLWHEACFNNLRGAAGPAYAANDPAGEEMPITAVDDGGGDCGGQIASMSAEAAQGGDGGSLASYPGLSEDGRAPRLMRRDSKHVREVSENTTRWKLCDKPDHVGERLMPVTSEWFYISKRQVAVCRQCKRRQVQRRPKLPDHGGANGGGAKSGVGSLGGVPTPTGEVDAADDAADATDTVDTADAAEASSAEATITVVAATDSSTAALQLPAVPHEATVVLGASAAAAGVVSAIANLLGGAVSSSLVIEQPQPTQPVFPQPSIAIPVVLGGGMHMLDTARGPANRGGMHMLDTARGPANRGGIHMLDTARGPANRGGTIPGKLAAFSSGGGGDGDGDDGGDGYDGDDGGGAHLDGGTVAMSADGSSIALSEDGSCVTIAVGGTVSLGGMTLTTDGEVTLLDGDGVALSADAAGSALGEDGVAELAHESMHPDGAFHQESMHLDGATTLVLDHEQLE